MLHHNSFRRACKTLCGLSLVAVAAICWADTIPFIVSAYGQSETPYVCVQCDVDYECIDGEWCTQGVTARPQCDYTGIDDCDRIDDYCGRYFDRYLGYPCADEEDTCGGFYCTIDIEP